MNNFGQRNSLKARDCLGTDGMNELKINELKKELSDLKTSFKWDKFALKCNAMTLQNLGVR